MEMLKTKTHQKLNVLDILLKNWNLNNKIFLGLILLLPSAGIAQDFYNMAQFARHQNLGTARNMGAGGAFSPLGNDFSAIHSNPAGVGVFRRPQTDISLGFSGYSQQTLSGSNAYDHRGGTSTIPNFGSVNVLSEERNSQSNFAFSYNQLSSFNNQFRAQDATVVQGVFFDDSLSVRSAGYLGEMGLTWGGHTNRKWYYGIGVGIPIGRFEEEYNSDYIEGLDNDIGIQIIDEFQIVNFIGINAKFGLIYRPIPALRLSFAAHTPSVMSANGEIAFVEFVDNIPNIPDTEIDGRDFNYRYNMTLPGRINTGVAYVFGKYGLITADYEFSDARAGNFRSRMISYDATNERIRDNLAAIHQVRSGVEARFQNFFLRGGYSYSTSGFAANFQNSGVHGIHGGAGFRTKNFAMDMAVVNFSQENNRIFPVSPVALSPINSTRSQTYFMLSATFMR